LADDELLVEIAISTPLAHSAGCYLRHTTREKMDIAVAGAASFLTSVPGKGRLNAARIALGAVAPTPLRAHGAEAVLVGKTVTPALVERAAEQAAREAGPISDIRGSAEYRREIVKVLVRRTLKKACKELGIEV
jgi:carbon-monoxide dehydrogenase medium subunit